MEALVMIKHTFYLPNDTEKQMQLKLVSRGFKDVSVYIRSLVDNDIKNISNKQSIEFSNQLKLIELMLESKSNEILQRCFILSKLVIEQMAKSGNKNFTTDNFQKLVNVFIDEAKSKYPIN
jgi:hypothetical protein